MSAAVLLLPRRDGRGAERLRRIGSALEVAGFSTATEESGVGSVVASWGAPLGELELGERPLVLDLFDAELLVRAAADRGIEALLRVLCQADLLLAAGRAEATQLELLLVAGGATPGALPMQRLPTPLPAALTGTEADSRVLLFEPRIPTGAHDAQLEGLGKAVAGATLEVLTASLAPGTREKLGPRYAGAAGARVGLPPPSELLAYVAGARVAVLYENREQLRTLVAAGVPPLAPPELEGAAHVTPVPTTALAPTVEDLLSNADALASRRAQVLALQREWAQPPQALIDWLRAPQLAELTPPRIGHSGIALRLGSIEQSLRALEHGYAELWEREAPAEALALPRLAEQIAALRDTLTQPPSLRAELRHRLRVLRRRRGRQ